MRRIRELARNDRGATIIEYGLIMALIFVVMMVAVRALAIQTVGTLNMVANRVSSASTL